LKKLIIKHLGSGLSFRIKLMIMRKYAILAFISLFIWSCTGTGNKNSSDNSASAVKEDLVTATAETPISSSPDFKTYTDSFIIGKFPFNLNEIHFDESGNLTQEYHQMTLESVRKYVNPEAEESKGYYFGYVMYEKEYTALISFYNYKTMFGGDNYQNSVDLQTYTPDGTLIAKISLGEKYSSVNSSAQRVSGNMEGSVKSDSISVIRYETFLEDQSSGSGKPLIFLIQPDGKIDVK
jgi:hypothetical protein